MRMVNIFFKACKSQFEVCVCQALLRRLGSHAIFSREVTQNSCLEELEALRQRASYNHVCGVRVLILQFSFGFHMAYKQVNLVVLLRTNRWLKYILWKVLISEL